MEPNWKNCFVDTTQKGLLSTHLFSTVWVCMMICFLTTHLLWRTECALPFQPTKLETPAEVLDLASIVVVLLCQTGAANTRTELGCGRMKRTNICLAVRRVQQMQTHRSPKPFGKTSCSTMTMRRFTHQMI